MNKKCLECNHILGAQYFKNRNRGDCKTCCICRCVCYECYYKFKNKNSLFKHLESKHQINYEKIQIFKELCKISEIGLFLVNQGRYSTRPSNTLSESEYDLNSDSGSEYEEHIPGFYSPKRERENSLKISKLSIEDEKTPSDSKKCIICTENKAIMLYDPCGHIFSCNSCFQKNPKTECSICRTIPKNVIRAYYPD